MRPKSIHKLVCSSIVVVWTAVFCVSFVKQVYFHENAKNMPSIRKAMAFVSIFTLCTLVTSHLSHILLLCLDHLQSTALEITIGGFFYLAFFLTILGYYIFMVLRLYFVFKGSIYSMSQKLVYLHIGLLAGICLTFIVAAILYEFPKEYEFSFGILAFSMVLYVTGLSHLVYSFNANLFALILSKRRSHVHFLPTPRRTDTKQTSPVSMHRFGSNLSTAPHGDASPMPAFGPVLSPVHVASASHHSTVPASPSAGSYQARASQALSVTDTFNDRQLSLLNTVIKHSVLGSIMIVSILICMIITAIISALGPLLSAFVVEVTFWWTQIITTCIIVACIVLGFNEAQHYYRNVCVVCDRKCGQFCEYLANKQAMDEIDDFGIQAVFDCQQQTNVIKKKKERPRHRKIKSTIDLVLDDNQVNLVVSDDENDELPEEEEEEEEEEEDESRLVTNDNESPLPSSSQPHTNHSAATETRTNMQIRVDEYRHVNGKEPQQNSKAEKLEHKETPGALLAMLPNRPLPPPPVHRQHMKSKQQQHGKHPINGSKAMYHINGDAGFDTPDGIKNRQLPRLNHMKKKLIDPEKLQKVPQRALPAVSKNGTTQNTSTSQT